MGKGLLESKTFWLNALAVLVEVGRLYFEVDSLPALNPALLAVLNVAVRLATKMPINGMV